MFLILSCSCLCPNHWSQVFSRGWRCSWSNNSWSSANRRCSNYIWVINNFIAYQGAPYIRGLMVHTMWLISTLQASFCQCTQPNERWRYIVSNIVSHWLGAYTKWSLHCICRCSVISLGNNVDFSPTITELYFTMCCPQIFRFLFLLARR